MHFKTPMSSYRYFLSGVLAFGLSLGCWSRTAQAEPASVFDRLTELDEPLRELSPAATAKERRLLRKVRRLRARRVITASQRPRRERRHFAKLRGSVASYALRVVRDGPGEGHIVAGFAACRDGGRCPALLANPCKKSHADCEGMYLALVFRPSGAGFVLDHMVGGGYYLLNNQDDIEDLRSEAP